MNVPVKITFSENLRSLLTEKGVSQADFARKMNTTPTSVQRWLKGETLPNNDTIDDIANFFSLDSWLLFKPGHKRETDPTERDDDFKTFMDELAQKLLSEHDLKAYHHFGGHRTVLKVMRENYETNDLKTTDWTRILIAEVGRYSTVDLMEKLKKRQEATAIPAKKSDSA